MKFKLLIIVLVLMTNTWTIYAQEPARWEIGEEFNLEGRDVFPLEFTIGRLHVRTDFVYHDGEYIKCMGYAEGADTMIWFSVIDYLKYDSMYITESWLGFEGDFVDYKVNSKAGLYMANGFYPNSFACGLYDTNDSSLVDYRYFVLDHGPVRSNIYGWLVGEHIEGGDGFLPLHAGNYWDFVDVPPYEGTTYVVEIASSPPGEFDFAGYVRFGDFYPVEDDTWSERINIGGFDVDMNFHVISTTETVQTPAGIFENCAYTKVDIVSWPFFEDSLKMYSAEGVGPVKSYTIGEEQLLEDFEIVGGYGYDPLEVGNWWQFGEDNISEITAFEEHNGYDCYRMENSAMSTTTWTHVDGPYVSVDEETPNRPSSITLTKNYPNPFNSKTVIGYDTGNIPGEFSVFNIRGQLVYTTSVNGSSAINWEGKDADGDPLSSGVYFYTLKCGDEIISEKMVLLK